MRLSRDQLVFRALVVLDEAIDACAQEPIKPGAGIRLALMFLHAIGRRDRSSHDAFWAVIQQATPSACSDEQARYFRTRDARLHMTGIARSAGVELDAGYSQELRIARMSVEDRRTHRAEEARLAEHRRRLRVDGWQYQAEDRAKMEREKAGDRGGAEATTGLSR